MARRVWEAAKKELARASSGSIEHLTRKDRDGHIEEWPVAELSVFDIGEGRQPANRHAVALPVLKSIYEQADLDWPDGLEDLSQEASARGAADKNEDPKRKQLLEQKALKMAKELTQADIDLAKEEARKNLLAEQAAEKKAAEEIQAGKDEAVKAALAKKKEEDEAEAKKKEEAEAEAEKKKKEDAIKANRLKDIPEGVTGTKYVETYKYDHLSLEDQAVLVGVLNAGDGQGRNFKRASSSALKALAIKTLENKEEIGVEGRQAMKMAGVAMKSDEIMQQDLTGFGDEWVGVEYSNALWASIRASTFVAQKLPMVVVPPGHESIVLPLEGADPTFFKVAEVEDENVTTGIPDATVPSSRMATDNRMGTC